MTDPRVAGSGVRLVSCCAAAPHPLRPLELELAVAGLDVACPADAELLEYESLRERCLPKVTWRGRLEHLQEALRASELCWSLLRQ